MREFFGEAITSYAGVYVVAPSRVPVLIRLLGGHDGDDLARTASATLRGGVMSGTRHGTSSGAMMIVWARLSVGTGCPPILR